MIKSFISSILTIALFGVFVVGAYLYLVNPNLLITLSEDIVSSGIESGKEFISMFWSKLVELNHTKVL